MRMFSSCAELVLGIEHCSQNSNKLNQQNIHDTVELKALFFLQRCRVHTEFRFESGMVIDHDNLKCLKVESPHKI